MNKIYGIGDIHGEIENLNDIWAKMLAMGFSFEQGDTIVQTGDRCDRGHNTFEVNDFFFQKWKQYPNQVICLRGNHEDMMINAANRPEGNMQIFLYNGGNQTIASYSKASGLHGVPFYYMLRDSGHWDWLIAQPLYYETNKYFFCHAPIPREELRVIHASGENYRNDKNTLIWSYEGDFTHNWVDHHLEGDKIFIHGHIHGLFKDKTDGKIKSPGVRRHGNSILLDTGSGCSPGAPLSCIVLPDLTVFDTHGNIYQPNRIDRPEFKYEV